MKTKAFRGNVRQSPSVKGPKAGRQLSETTIGHQLHSGEIVRIEFWRLMLICLEVTLPDLKRGEIYRAADLVDTAMWDRLYRNERHRMGRCLFSLSRDPGAPFKLVPNRGKSPWPRRYCLL